MSEVTAASQPSEYNDIFIYPVNGSEESRINIKAGVVEFQYFEDLHSPCYTALMQVVNDGGNIGGVPSLYNNLPIRGGEKVTVHITTPWEKSSGKTPGVFELTFYVNSVRNYLQTKQIESFTLDLVSKEALLNLRKRITKKYKDKRIDEVVKVLMEAVEAEEPEIEKTQNTYNFIGNLRKPFTIAPLLAVRGIPEGATSKEAGYFFWQTRTGMKFKSIKKMIDDGTPFKYGYYLAMDNVNDEKSKWTTILTYTVDNNNIADNAAAGEYSTYRIYWNPHTFEFTEPDRSLFKPEQESLGTEDIEHAEVIDPEQITKPEFAHRIVSGVYNVGCLNKEVNTDVNMDQLEDVSQAISRYKSIFHQSLSMTVPVNVELQAGDVIKCYFPRVSAGDEPADYSQSGLYIIKELTHFFDPKQSYTAMRIVRDTSGD
tara:strand:- start:294 stop:1577 length:1284 start_codon:yes stop_codon:yes gene_type:complete